MKVLVYPVGKPSEVKEIKGDLPSMQSIVGGYIEMVRLLNLTDSRTIDLFCNEEGKLDGLLPNMPFGNDIICGDFFVCAGDENTGESVGLTDFEVEHIRKLLGR